MGIRQNYSSPTPTLSHVKLQPKIFYKDINPDIEKRFDTSDQPTNHLSGIKTELNGKVSRILRMTLVGSRLLNLLI